MAGEKSHAQESLWDAIDAWMMVAKQREEDIEYLRNLGIDALQIQSMASCMFIQKNKR